MKENELMVLFFAGLTLFSAAGILLARKIIVAAFSLGMMLFAIAGMYAALNLQAALLSQLVLYIGGIMVLIGFAMQLYPEPAETPPWKKVRESAGKGFLLLVIMLICLFYAPWASISIWVKERPVLPFREECYQLDYAGRHLMLDFPLEFEWLGILMLGGLMVAGFYLKENYSDSEK